MQYIWFEDSLSSRQRNQAAKKVVESVIREHIAEYYGRKTYNQASNKDGKAMERVIEALSNRTEMKVYSQTQTTGRFES